MRAEAQRQFGRPAGSTPSASENATDPETGALETGATESGGEATVSRAQGGSGDPADSSRGTPPGATEPAESTGGGEPAQSTGAAVSTDAPVEAPATGQAPDAALLLADADEAYSGLRSLRAAFVQRVDLPLVDRTAQGHGTWYQVGRGRFRMDFIDPPDDVFVSDGEFLWLYQPSATPGQAIKSPLGGAGGQAAGGADVLANILSEARSSYDAVYEGTAIVSGVRSHVITLTPRGPSEYRLVRVWVADRDRLVRRFRIEEQNETIRTVTLAELEPNVALPDSLFRFTPPEGVEVFDRGGGP
ncbi:MAG: outer membrane lipoprotein carrier protein LolA [Gemmatimonadota bacterium]